MRLYAAIPAVIIVLVLSAVLPSPVVAAGTASCNGLAVVSGNNRFVPSSVTLRADATDTAGAVQGYRFFFGDGTTQDSVSPDAAHTYAVSGTFTARADVKDSGGVWTSSMPCQAIFSLLTNPLESQKSGCSNVFILGDNTVPAGTNVKFLVTGYDNKSGIQEYKIDFGDGRVSQSNIGSFNLAFPTPGTFTVRGAVRDSKNKWLNSDSCQTALYVTGAPIIVQPATGTPTVYTAVGLTAGLLLASLYILRVQKII